jgi:hypothetical protein
MEDKKEVAVIEKDEKTRGFELVQRQAKMLASSSMVPAQFQGDKNLGNCIIAMELAERMKVSVFALMQAMYVVHGKPGLEGKFIAALINQSGIFGQLQYEYQGQGKTDKGIDRPERCRALAINVRTSEVIYGPWITWDMVKANGWQKDKVGQNRTEISKWQLLPELMFPYRAATYFARVNCPEVLMGMMLREEVEELPPEAPKLMPMENITLAPGVDPYNIQNKPLEMETVQESVTGSEAAPMEEEGTFNTYPNTEVEAKEIEKNIDEIDAQSLEPEPEKVEPSPLRSWNDKDTIQCKGAKKRVFIQVCDKKCNESTTCSQYSDYLITHEKRV